MRNIILILTLYSLFGCNNNRNKRIAVSESDLKQAIFAFTELKEALKKDNGRLWNHKLDGPILLINRDSKLVIANGQDENGELVKLGDCFVGKFPDSLIIAHSFVFWNNKRWTMYSFPLPDSKEERLNGLIHESFHRIQPEIGFDSLYEIQSDHLDTKEGRIYLKLELEALKGALISEEPLIHIKDALLFRQFRHQLFPEAKESENSLEINEGIAQYTSSTLIGLTGHELQKYYISQIDTLFRLSTFVRSFAYYTTPAYGYFMRQSDEKWNLKINKRTNLTDFILTFYKIKPSNLSSESIETVGKLYNMNTIIESEELREFKRLAQIKKYKKVFLGDSAVTIRLENIEIGFNPGNLIPLDSFGTVYPNLVITDNWGILNVDSCGALVSSDWKYVTISYPKIITDTLITGKGWKLKLDNHWEFNKEEKKFKIASKH